MLYKFARAFFPLTLTIAFQYNFARLHIDTENAIDRKGGGGG